MSVVQANESVGFRVRGWHVAAGVSAFFAVVIGVDAAFTVMAIRSNPGQVSVTPYEDGLLYNRRIAQMDAQARLGWRASAAAEPGRVVVRFVDAEGAPVRGLELSARLERPATEAGRIAPAFRETTPGRYEAAVSLAGTWDLSAEARDGRGAVFLAERRLSWP